MGAASFFFCFELQEIGSLLIKDCNGWNSTKQPFVGSRSARGFVLEAKTCAARGQPTPGSDYNVGPSEQISLLNKTLLKLVYIVFAWLTLYAIELENVVCIVRPLNNVFFFF